MPTETTFAGQYLSKLDTILDRHRFSNGDVPLKDRERRLTSPLPYSATREPVGKHAARLKLYDKRQTGVSSEGELSSSSTSSLTSSDEELGYRGRSQSHVVSSARVNPASMQKSWRKGGQVLAGVAWKERHSGTSRHHPEAVPSGDGDGKTHHDHSQTAVLQSLHSINSQLGQLLNRVGDGPSDSSVHPLAGGGGQGGASISNNSMYPGHTQFSVEEPLGMSSSSR